MRKRKRIGHKNLRVRATLRHIFCFDILTEYSQCLFFDLLMGKKIHFDTLFFLKESWTRNVKRGEVFAAPIDHTFCVIRKNILRVLNCFDKIPYAFSDLWIQARAKRACREE